MEVLVACAIIAIFTALLIPATDQSGSGFVTIVIRAARSHLPPPEIYVAVVPATQLPQHRQRGWNDVGWWSLSEAEGVWMKSELYDVTFRQQTLTTRTPHYRLLRNTGLLLYPQPDGTARVCSFPLERAPDQRVIDVKTPPVAPPDAEFVARVPAACRSAQ